MMPYTVPPETPVPWGWRDAQLGKPLTPAQIETLQLIANGLTTRQIANYRHRSMSTVQHHRTNAIERLGAKSITHAVGLAMKRGIVR